MNNFYLLKGELNKAAKGLYNAIGSFIASNVLGEYCLQDLLTGFRYNNKQPICIMPAPDIAFLKFSVFCYDKNSKFLVSKTGRLSDTGTVISEPIFIRNSKVDSIAISFKIDITQNSLSQMTEAEIASMLTKVWFYAGYEIKEPHYSKLESKYTKETSQIFLRNSLEGTVKLAGYDYSYIYSARLETKFLFLITNSSDSVIALNSFVKTDCKFDNFRKIVQPKFTAIDKYSRIIDKYDNTYDLIKLAPKITPLTLTKRLLYQFYIQGGNTVTCYANGTYWEQDVDEAVDKADTLKNKYYFAETYNKQEISISTEESSAFAGEYMYDNTSRSWVCVNDVEQQSRRIYFEAITDAEKATYGTNAWKLGTVFNISTGKDLYGVADIVAKKRLYRIKMKDFKSAGSLGNYESTHIYYVGNFVDVRLSTDLSANYTLTSSKYGTINLEDMLITYAIWARVLADVDSITNASGQTTTLYDLPSDDFVTERVNYRKCVGLIGLHVIQSGDTVAYPTKYGRTDYGNYFTSNVNYPSSIKSDYLPIPVCKSTWGNTSIWAIIPNNWRSFESMFMTTYTLKDAYALSDAIKALLHKIDPLIKFDGTKEYSQFLYDENFNAGIATFDTLRVGYKPYITPKSNVLKGNYDQAAQKAEVTFEQIMNMLRDCFRCYWFIDDNNRLRIEHISYFMSGMSYSSKNAQIDLTTKYDKFNRKPVLYVQEETSYTKDDLNSRYEFGWMDDSSDIFEDIEIDMQSVYTQSDKTEEINSEVFSTDVDLMLYAPDKFSNDGFVLMMAKDGKVPIISVSDLRDDEYNKTYTALPQNYLCSWLYLARYYMADMPAKTINYTRAPSADAYRVSGLKQFVNQDVKFQTQDTIDLNMPIKTSVGLGLIDSMSTNIDTGMISATLKFSPSE